MKCRADDCTEEGTPTAVHINTYADHTKRTRVRLTVLVELCAQHRYVHGYAWTARAMPHDGTFPADYAEFHELKGRLPGPIPS